MDETGAPTSVSLTSSTTVDNASLMEANSSGDVMLDLSIYLRFASNRRVHDAAFYSLISAYSLLMVIGAAGNLLVVYAVVRQPAMRTVRNVFIINLAVSDLLLCVVTMPLTMMEVLSNTWQLGNSPFLCKMVGSLQAISIFVSTMSIAAIALDRYQLIVYPTQSSCQKAGALTALVTIWIASILLATPLFIWRTLQHQEIPIPNFPIQSVDYCFEQWPTKRGRAIYSAVSILIQYALPIVTVSFAHVRISYKLRYRLTTMNTSVSDARKQQARQDQLQKTNRLLVAIAIIFGVCWLPLNIFNVVNDTFDPFDGDTETMFITYSVCHMTGMSSACANPLLYGWLNDNFRKEFCAIWASVTDRFRSAPRHPKLASDKSATNRPQITNSIVSAFPPSMGNQTKVSTHVIAIAEIPDQSSNPPDVSKSV